jgi:hypothetical protein
MPPKGQKKTKRSGDDVQEECAKKVRVRIDPPEVMESGTSVRFMHGKHAGEVGNIMGHDGEDGFYEVALPGGHVYEQRTNLLPRYEVLVMSLEGRAELNGRKGLIDGWDGDRERYEVVLWDANTSRVKLLPRNVMLPHGARGRVHGLVGAPQHNGCLGRVTDYDDDVGRYTLEYVNRETDSLAWLRLKRENVRLV